MIFHQITRAQIEQLKTAFMRLSPQGWVMPNAQIAAMFKLLEQSVRPKQRSSWNNK